MFRSDIRYIGQFTQESTGAVATFGFPLGNGFTRMFMNYSYERVRVTEISDLYTRAGRAAAQPVPARLAADRPERRARHQQGHAEHRPQHGGQADLPDHGRRYTLSIDLAGLGGNTNFYKPIDRGRLVLEAERTG